MFNPDAEEERFLFLLNSFAGSVTSGPWSAHKSTQYHMDEFGNSIRVGDLFLLRAGPTNHVRRLSLDSARRLWSVLIEDNGRSDEFRLSMQQAQRQIYRDEAEAEGESYEDLRDNG